MGCEPVTTQAGLWAVGVLVFGALGLVGVGALLAVGSWLGNFWVGFLALSGGACVGMVVCLARALVNADSNRAHAAGRAAAAGCAGAGAVAVAGLNASVDAMAVASCSVDAACAAVIRTGSQCGARVEPFFYCYGPRRRLDGLYIDWGDDYRNATADDGDDDAADADAPTGDDASDDDWRVARGDDAWLPTSTGAAGLSSWVHDDCADGGGADDACYAFDSPAACAAHRFSDDRLGDDDCDLGKSPRDVADIMARAATCVILFYAIPALALAYFSRRRQLKATVAVAPVAAPARAAPPLPVALPVAADKYR